MPEIRNPAPNDRFIIVYPQDFSFPWVFRIEVPSIAALIPLFFRSWWSPDLKCIQEANVPGTESLQQVLCHPALFDETASNRHVANPVKGKDRLPTIIFQGQAGKNFGGVPQDYKSAFFFQKHHAVTHLKSLHWSEVKLPPKEVRNQALKFTTERMSFCTKRQFLGSSRWISGGVYNFSEAMN